MREEHIQMQVPKMTMKSPLIPREGGYPLTDYPNIKEEDLEVEYIRIKKGSSYALVPVLNPFLMKGALKEIKAQNAKDGALDEALIDEIAEQIGVD